ncbi:hypothetical protein [Flavobacterium laiguense]|uniref:Uncharacterized protein n=1 Tax=Flavobacterium laiguense TaxID=2169409 RepID=A0A2U1JT27_9FLAO|nr:hypothetical protein [Flavobacterium laiguense]PWA08360.1 hypothetical protein DB891_12210 [Flavobacterium laiguense]
MKNSVIENQFREKINTREIVPSKASWDRLDAMLTVAEKPKRNFKWMYIAASFLGFLMISTLYFDKNKKGAIINNDNIVVNEPKITPEISVKSVKVNLVKVETTKVVEKKLASKEMKSEIDSNSIVSNAAIQVAQKGIIEEHPIPIINQKAEQKLVLQKSKYVNVDELLASVDNATQENGLRVVKFNVKVNSNELLTQVDGELDLSFREKAIKTVNQKFRTAKLALSNRNSK